MKKLLIFSVVFLSYLTVQAQLQGVGTFRIADASTQFGYSIPQGSTVFNIDNGKMYFIRDNIKFDKTLAQLTAGTDYFNFLSLSGGMMTGTINSLSIIPTVTDTYNLGSPSMEWNILYAKNASFSGLIGMGSFISFGDGNIEGNLAVSNAATITGTLTVADTIKAVHLNNIKISDLVTISDLPDSLQKAYSFADYHISDSATYTAFDTISVSTTTTDIFFNPTRVSNSYSYNMNFSSNPLYWSFKIPGVYKITLTADATYPSGDILIIMGMKYGYVFRRTIESHDSSNPTNITINEFINVTQADIDYQNNNAALLFYWVMKAYLGTFNVYFYDVHIGIEKM